MDDRKSCRHVFSHGARAGPSVSGARSPEARTNHPRKWSRRTAGLDLRPDFQCFRNHRLSQPHDNAGTRRYYCHRDACRRRFQTRASVVSAGWGYSRGRDFFDWPTLESRNFIRKCLARERPFTSHLGLSMFSFQIYPITKALGYVSLAVADLESATQTAQEVLGLRCVHADATKTYLSSNDRQVELMLSSAPKPGLLAVGLEASNEDSFQLLKARLSEANVKFSEARGGCPGVTKLIRFFLPSGHPIELHSSVGQTQPSFYPTAGVRPRRLGHAL